MIDLIAWVFLIGAIIYIEPVEIIIPTLLVGLLVSCLQLLNLFGDGFISTLWVLLIVAMLIGTTMFKIRMMKQL